MNCPYLLRIVRNDKHYHDHDEPIMRVTPDDAKPVV